MKHTCTACGHVDEINIGKLIRAIPSKARSKASAENGKKGGRPKKPKPENNP